VDRNAVALVAVTKPNCLDNQLRINPRLINANVKRANAKRNIVYVIQMAKNVENSANV